jgi:hypothetical protein
MPTSACIALTAVDEIDTADPFSVQGMELQMKRRSFVKYWTIALSAILLGPTGGASAARLPTSTLTVDVLSVEPENVNREETKFPSRPTVVFETTKFVAKAKINKVMQTDHGLSVGDVIVIRYRVTTRQPPDPGFRVRPSLSAGQIVTITVAGGGGSFTLRN